LATKVYVDNERCHETYILQWLAHSLEFKALITDFAIPKPWTNLAQDSGVPPAARVDLETGKALWKNFWEGNISIQQLMEEVNSNKVVLVTPERNQGPLKLLASKFQRDIMELAAQNHFMPLGGQLKEFRLGLLFNVHRFPLKADGELQVAAGLNLQEMPFLQVGNWALFTKIHILQVPKYAQFGIGWGRMIQRSSYWCVLEVNSESEELKELVANMHNHKKMPTEQFPVKLDWGSMRVCLEHEEFMIRKDPVKHFQIPTWQFQHFQFPHINMYGEPLDPVMGVDSGFRASLDIPAEHKGEVEEFLQDPQVSTSTSAPGSPMQTVGMTSSRPGTSPSWGTGTMQ
jgi:hypothetical protein